MKINFAALLFALCLLTAAANSQSLYKLEIENWRADQTSKLTADDGWLTLAGLFWLKEGSNTIGSGDGFDVELTENFKRGRFGVVELRDGIATLRVDVGINATSNGNAVSTIELVSDIEQKQTVIEVGSQSFYLIKRQDRFAIRLKDKDSASRRNFRGLKWFPVNRAYRIVADFEPFAESKIVDIPNVLGGVFKLESPGMLRFKIRGKQFMLQPVLEGERLFIIFRDLSSKTSTYAAGRFLYAEKAVNGKVILDFNKAENPPCAYTAFATCPLPPRQNRLAISINAGEKRFVH